MADAEGLPLADSGAANIVMVDVMHRIESPAEFFRMMIAIEKISVTAERTLDRFSGFASYATVPAG